ncbi:2-oxoacid:acceptor oxidoreductase family protein, partial [Xanthomonas arboricola]|uniref:2-oxoacid:acceptor oxidoreductase family protein n=1 Tax=Xanthomonas arboricola TaxID=56448 RepID=UPI0019D2F905
MSRTLRSFDALAAAQELFGNTAAANFLLIGAAYQSGGLRLPAEAIEEAIGINGVAVDANIAAFRWGRAAIADTAAFSAVTTPAKSVREPVVAPAHMFAGTTFTGETLRLVELRAAQLIEFQSVKIAQRYID